MAKRRRQSKAKTRARQRSRSKSSPRIPGTLIVVDQKPFLKKALARCQRIRRDLAKRNEALAEFNESDLPAFQSWMAATFGAQLTQLREDHDAITRLEGWLYEVDFALDVVGVPENEVYEYVRKHREDPDYWDPRYDDDPEDIEEAIKEEEAAFEEMEDDERAMFEDFFKGLAEDVFGMDAEELEKDPGFPGWSPGAGKRTPDPGAARKRETSELKQLYRRLARRLHPDVSRTESEVSKKRWEQLQTAYAAGDLEKLRALEAVCDADETGLSVKLGLATLNSWARYHNRLLKPLQAAMRDAKKHPAWGFRAITKKKLERFKKEARADLDYDCEVVRSRRAQLENALDYYRAFAKKPPRKATRKRTQKKTKNKRTQPKSEGPHTNPRSKRQSEFPF